MRTTLDLDETVLSAARAKSAAEGISLGRAVSALALRGLERVDVVRREGFPVFNVDPGHLITDELVALYRDDL